MQQFRVIIAGGRDFDDYQLLKLKCDKILAPSFKFNNAQVIIISGGANGADKLGERYAKYKDLRCIKYPADWDTHGKSAGYIRNKEMAENAEALIAFWDGSSKGTKMMIDLAEERGLKVRVIKYA